MRFRLILLFPLSPCTDACMQQQTSPQLILLAFYCYCLISGQKPVVLIDYVTEINNKQAVDIIRVRETVC